ncbi:hypothetical protein RP20_CCG009471 [Aedes albopictus]|nr:hypothetical protein RP20_CCG009471 [Aedes albopictus]
MPEESLSLEFVKCRLLDEEIKQRGAGVELAASKVDGAAFTGSKKQRKKKKWRCFGCQEEGHKLSECPRNQQRDRGFKHGKQRPNANLANDKAVSFVTLANGSGISEKRRVQWFVDSGCSDHLVKDEELFEELRPLKKPVEIAVAKDGETIVARHSGTVKLISVVNGECIPCTVNNVLYVPSLRFNLFSVLNVEKRGMKVVFNDGKVHIWNGSELVASGSRHGKLYELNLYTVDECESESLIACGRIKKSLELWHRRFGHLNKRQLEQLVCRNLVDGMQPTQCDGSDDKVIVCEPCIIGKQSRKPFSAHEGKRSSRVLEVIHVCGPVQPAGRNGERYFATFMDDWTHFVMTFPMKTKDEVLGWFEYYESLVTAKFGLNISRLKCDNGGEYQNKALLSFCRRKGIQVDFTVPYTPQQNGTSERMNRTLVERVRAMLEDAKIEKVFWVQAIETAAYIVNRCPTSANDSGKTPVELWNGRRPDVSRLRTFGCVAYVHVPKERRKKLDAKAWRGVFVGYAPNGYRVWNPKTGSIVVARDVDFVESKSAEEEKDAQKKVNIKKNDVIEFAIENEERRETEEISEEEEANSGEEDDEDEEFTSMIEEENPRAESGPENPEESVAIRRSVRNRNAPVWHRDYEVDHASFALNALSFVEDLPESLSDLQIRDDRNLWQQAMKEEMDSLERNGTWTLTKLPAGRSAISCKWIFKIKPGEDGQPTRYKARLVARGFSQKRGFDYSETYSPVARLDTLRTVLAMANREGMVVHKMDVKTVFLNGELTEEIYMEQPEGFTRKENLVCRLKRSLYGLKQASRQWNECFNEFVKRLGFERSVNDPCLYIRGTGKDQVVLVLYVDDVLIVSPSEKLIYTVKACLAKKFEMTDVGEVRNFLGMKIDRNKEKKIMCISQRRYLESLLSRFQMEDCSPISTPMENRLKLPKGEESKRTSKPYRELVGCIMYASLTSRPDLAATANYFSQFQACPTDEHWVHLRRVLRYVKGTLDLGLIYRGDADETLLAVYTDADWANDIVDRRSVSGAVFKVFGASVCWFARKQPTVSLSSTEAELVALCGAACHSQWLVRVLCDLGWSSKEPVRFYEDNQSTIKIVSNPKDSGRLKHIDVKHFYVRELLEGGCIQIDYIPSKMQQADIFTKSLPAPAFRNLRANLGVDVCRV